jgi:hypothetical protein
MRATHNMTLVGNTAKHQLQPPCHQIDSNSDRRREVKPGTVAVINLAPPSYELRSCLKVPWLTNMYSEISQQCPRETSRALMAVTSTSSSKGLRCEESMS